jgi:hypothetical protein
VSVASGGDTDPVVLAASATAWSWPETIIIPPVA